MEHVWTTAGTHTSARHKTAEQQNQIKFRLVISPIVPYASCESMRVHPLNVRQVMTDDLVRASYHNAQSPTAHHLEMA